MNYLTREEFGEFKDNDFCHVKKQVDNLSKRIANIEGKISILVPLTFVILTGIVGLIVLAVV